MFADVEETGGSKSKVNRARVELENETHVILEKYLPVFQEKFEDSLGIGEVRIGERVEVEWDEMIHLPWGDDLSRML